MSIDDSDGVFTRPIVVTSEHGPWMRRFLLLVGVVNMILGLVLIWAIGEEAEDSDSRKTMICALMADDAEVDPLVGDVYREHCG